MNKMPTTSETLLTPEQFGPGVDTPMLEQAREIHQVVHRLRTGLMRQHSKMSCMDDFGVDLTMSQINTLMMVSHEQPVTIKRLAEAMCVSAPSASSMVDKLVEVGMLTREQSKVDRREVVVCLSGKAEAIMQQLEAMFLSYILDIMKRLTPGHRHMWIETYQAIGAALDQQAGEAARIQEPEAS